MSRHRQENPRGNFLDAINPFVYRDIDFFFSIGIMIVANQCYFLVAAIDIVHCVFC